MKKNRKLLSLLLAVFMLFSVPAYTYVPALAATATSSTLKNQTKNFTMVKGQKTTIKPPVKMTYSSNNTKVATVSSKGVVTAKAKGSAVVTGKYKSVKWVYKIKVEQPKLNRTSLSMTTGKSYQLKVSGTTRKYSWSSSNSKIVSVSSSGKLKARRAGTAYVSAKINSVNFKCKVTVEDPVEPEEPVVTPEPTATPTPAPTATPIPTATPTPTPKPTEAPKPTITPEPITQTVWLSATGSKYHRIPNCGKMNPANARKVDLSYAQSHGYTACSKCF